MNNKNFRVFNALTAPALVLITFAACGGSSTSPNTPFTTTITATQTRSSLTVAANETLAAPTGESLTLTVDGVEKNIGTGTVTGNVVLDVTKDHDVAYMWTSHKFRMGLYLEDGAVVADKSVESSLVGVTYNGSYATSGSISSKGDNFNGIVVGGTTGTADHPYSINNMSLNFVGNGSNDFAGYGAALMTTGSANVVINRVNVTTDGCIRPAVWAGGTSVLTVENSTIVANSATAAEAATVHPTMLKEVPWLLGISGNNRATNVLESAQVTYKNCSISAESWGALSTDSCQTGATLTAIDCKVAITGTSGYASYADAAVINTYTHCTFDAPDYVLIVAAGACGATFQGNDLGNTVATSGRFGIMWHKNQNGHVYLKPGTVFHSGETMFLVKSDVANTAYPNLEVDGATLSADNGVIFHLMESDDAGMNMSGGGPGSDTMWNSSYTVPVVVPVVDSSVTSTVNADTVNATFKNMDVKGDIYNSRWTAGQNLNVAFVKAQVTGVISAGLQANRYVAAGGAITPDTRQFLGEETVTPHAVYSNGVIVNLDAASSWTVTGDSYLSSLTVADAGSIKATAGTVKMSVNGVVTAITVGTFTGNVRLYLN